MKKSILLLAIILCSCSNKLFKNNFIGEKNDDKIVTTKLADSVVKSWNIMLKTNKIKGEIKEVSIKSAFDEVNKKHYYYLFSKTSNDSVKIACLLILKRDKFYFNRDISYVAICHGCNSTYPIFQFDNWGWGCDSKELSTDCKKTEVLNLN